MMSGSGSGDVKHVLLSCVPVTSTLLILGSTHPRIPDVNAIMRTYPLITSYESTGHI